MRLVYGVPARPHYKAEYLEVPIVDCLLNYIVSDGQSASGRQ